MTAGSRMLGYVRVSTADQAANGHGLEAQEQAIRAAAAYRGWELVELIRDNGASGKDLDRPGFRRALEAIARGEADGLVVSKMDRMSRSLIHALQVLEWFEAAGAALVVLDIGLDTTSPTGWLVVRVLAVLAEWERRAISTRTSDALAELRRQGRPVGRASVAPELAGRIRAARDAGSTWQAIADELNAEGIPTVRGGAAWRPSSVQTAGGYRRPPKRAASAELPPLPRRRAANGHRRGPESHGEPRSPGSEGDGPGDPGPSTRGGSE